MMRKVLFLIAILSTVSLMGIMSCDEEESITLEDFVQQEYDGVCNYLPSCCTTQEISSAAIPYILNMMCEDGNYSDSVQTTINSYQDSIEKGWTSYNGNKAHDCIEQIKSIFNICKDNGLLISELQQLDTGVCDEVFTPHQNPGDDCNQDKDCINGVCHEGKCVAYLGIGEDCNTMSTEGRECGEGLTCGSEGKCVEQEPVTLSGIGEECGSMSDCDSGVCNNGVCEAVCDGN